MIDAFLFDMGNVLVRFSHERMCRQVAAVAGTSPEEIRRLLFDTGVQADTECGRLSERDFHAWLQRQVGRSLDFAALIRAAADIFERNHEIEPIIEALADQGRRLVLLSNTNRSHIEHVRRMCPALRRFDAFVLSCEVGAMKPDAAIFRAALAAVESAPERCFYTDDIPAYVAAGRRHGLHAEVFTTAAALREQLQARGVDLPP